MRRRAVNVFGLSFLDVMFCGFGSVILLVMIVNADAITRREQVRVDLRGEVDRLQREVLEGERFLVEMRDSLESTHEKRVATQAQSLALARRIAALTGELAALEAQTLATSEDANRLKVDLKSLDEERRRLAAQAAQRAAEEAERGRNVREFVGDGNRQYLTGLKMGGKRILVLVDDSASMLDRTIVNVIRRRNLSAGQRRRAPKWRQALATVEWLVSQLPQDSRFQIYRFSTDAAAVLEGTGGKWLDAADPKVLDDVVKALYEVAPADGTSLYNAFAAIGALRPAPDNIFLLTDGLPTQGRTRPLGSKVSGKKRLAHYERAVPLLPRGVPVNTILFAMEGDPLAATAFWKLAGYTNGSFISPSKDWP